MPPITQALKGAGINLKPTGLQGGGYHGGAAVVIPKETGTMGETFAYLQRENYRRQQEELRRAQQDQARADMLSKFVGDEFKDKDFATGTASDPAINGLLGTMRGKYTSMIKANPNLPMADLIGAMQKDISEMNAWSSAVKTKRDQITKAAEGLKGYKNIDVPGVSALAMHNFLYKVDENGKKVLRNPSELDVDQDYITDILTNTPEMVLRSGYQPDEAEMIKKQPTARVDNITVTDDNGIKREKGYKSELYPFQEIINTPAGPAVRVTSKKEKVGDKEIEVADDKLYSMYNDLESQTWLNSEVKKMGISPSSKEGEIAKRHIVYERNKGVAPKEFSPVDKTNEDVWLAKYQAGVLGSALTANMKAIRAAIEGKGFDDTDLILQTVSGLDQELISAAPVVTIGGKDYKDVSALAQNNLIATMRGGKKVYNQVLMDPAKPGTAIVYDINDQQQRVESSRKELSGKELKDYIVKNAPFNGSNAKKALFKTDPYFENGQMKTGQSVPLPTQGTDATGKVGGNVFKTIKNALTPKPKTTNQPPKRKKYNPKTGKYE